MPETADTNTPPDPPNVVVIVTTIRLAKDGEIEAARHHIAHGEFDQALRHALEGRLQRWALDQVLGRIRARRPARGEPTLYGGWFGTQRLMLVAVRPSEVGEEAGAGKRRAVKGLFLPEAAPVREAVAVAA